MKRVEFLIANWTLETLPESSHLNGLVFLLMMPKVLLPLILIPRDPRTRTKWADTYSELCISMGLDMFRYLFWFIFGECGVTNCALRHSFQNMVLEGLDLVCFYRMVSLGKA